MRYRQDIMRDIGLIEGKIASNRRLVELTAKARTAGICDAVLPSLLRRLRALRMELGGAIDRPPAGVGFALPDGTTAAPQAILSRTTPLSDDEIAALEIPAFLRRA